LKGIMMDKTHDRCVRGFSIRSEAWYGKMPLDEDMLDEIMVGMYHPEGGTTGEFGVRWSMIGGEATPRLEVFNDAWSALVNFTDLLEWMASVDDQHVSPKEFSEALKRIGVKDLTERINPYKSQSDKEYDSWFTST
jgi:hypothetical protein